MKKIFNAYGSIYKDYGRDDLGVLNNLVRYGIYGMFLLDMLMIITYPIVGYEDIGHYGPFSTVFDIGLTTNGMVIEALATLFVVSSFINVVRARIYFKLKNLN